MRSREEFVHALNEAAIRQSGKVRPKFNEYLLDNAVREARKKGLIPPNLQVTARKDGWYDYPDIYYWGALICMQQWLKERRPRKNHMIMAGINEDVLQVVKEWMNTGKNFWE